MVQKQTCKTIQYKLFGLPTWSCYIANPFISAQVSRFRHVVINALYHPIPLRCWSAKILIDMFRLKAKDTAGKPGAKTEKWPRVNTCKRPGEKLGWDYMFNFNHTNTKYCIVIPNDLGKLLKDLKDIESLTRARCDLYSRIAAENVINLCFGSTAICPVYFGSLESSSSRNIPKA